LNLRLHPYQQSRAERYADQGFRRSLATVRGEVMRCCHPLASLRKLSPGVRAGQLL
jgi:hypothetical protein